MKRIRTGSKTIREAKNAIRGAYSGFASASDQGRILKHGQVDLGQAVSTSLDSLPLEEYPEIIDWFRRSLGGGPYIYPRLPIRHEYKFEPNVFAGPTDDIAGIIWLVENLTGAAEKLKKFEFHSDRFEAACFSENYLLAADELSEIENAFGPSLWLIQTRIAFLHITEGVEAQKQYAKSIQDLVPQTLPSFVAHYTSQRNEEKLTLARFIPRMERIIAQQFFTGGLKISEHTKRSQEALRSYLRFFLLDSISTKVGEIAKISIVAPFLSPIDSYQILLRILESIAKSEIHLEHWPRLGDCLNKLGAHLPTIFRMSNYFLGNEPIGSVISTEIDDLFYSGRFDQCAQSAAEASQRNPRDVEAMRYAAMSAAILGHEELPAKGLPILRPILSAFATVYRRKSGLSSAADEIAKFSLNFKAWRFARILEAYFRAEWRDGARTAWFPAVGAYFYGTQVKLTHSHVVRPQFGQAIIELFPKNGRSAALEASLAQVFGTVKSNCTVNGNLLHEALLVGMLARREFAAAKSVSLLHPEDTAELWKRRAASHSIEALTLAGDIDEAIKKIAEICCEEDELRNVIPFRLVLGDLRWRDLRKFKTCISLSIALDLYVRTVTGDEHLQNRRYAYEEFRVSAGDDFPSRLDLSSYPLNQRLYFYSRVCVPSIMDFSFKLFPTSSRALDDERTKICALLVRLDPDPTHVQAYNDEIRDITTRQKLQDGLRDINSSRVYVNVDAIKRWALNEFVELYEQCKPLLLKSRNPERRAAFNESLIALLEGKSAINKPEGTVNLFSYPEDEGAELFVDIIESIGQEYLTNADDGLVAYLSSRIRHGSFAGHLRAPVEDAKIITVRSKDTRNYEPDEYWTAQFQNLDSAQRIALQKAIEDFSKKYDTILDNAVENYLFVRSAANPNGLIGFHNVTVFYHIILNSITEDLTFAKFIDLVFESLPGMVSGSLEVVQDYINQDIKFQIEECLESLLARIEKHLPPVAARPMAGAIFEARKGAHRAIVTVANWFKTARNESEATYRTFDEILDIAIAATKSANHGFAPLITRDVNVAALLFPASLHYFTDIFFIILTNIANHSNNPDTKVHILVQGEPTAISNEKLLTIRVVNDVVRKDQIIDQTKLNQIRALIDRGEYRLHANKEGGSGLLKLSRYISSKANQSLNFGFISEDQFSIELRVILTTFSP